MAETTDVKAEPKAKAEKMYRWHLELGGRVDVVEGPASLVAFEDGWVKVNKNGVEYFFPASRVQEISRESME